MLNRKNYKTTLANSFALAMAIIWVVCSVFVMLLPGLSMSITKAWMHGLDMQVLGDWHFTLGNFFFGGVTAIIASYLTGWIFGWSWERANGR